MPAISLDTSELPLVKLYWPRECETAEVAEFIENLTTLAYQESSFVMVCTIAGASLATVEKSAPIRVMLQEHRLAFARNFKACGIVVPSVVVHAATTAFLGLVSIDFPVRAFVTSHDARAWCVGVLLEGEEMPYIREVSEKVVSR